MGMRRGLFFGWLGVLERIDTATVGAALFVVLCVLVTLKTRVRVQYAVSEAL
jgi:hypothetical protein